MEGTLDLQQRDMGTVRVTSTAQKREQGATSEGRQLVFMEEGRRAQDNMVETEEGDKPQATPSPQPPPPPPLPLPHETKSEGGAGGNKEEVVSVGDEKEGQQKQSLREDGGCGEE